jgi:hypothetical protein
MNIDIEIYKLSKFILNGGGFMDINIIFNST